MKILVVAHSPKRGGAEAGLRNLVVNLLALNYEAEVLLPHGDGEEEAYYQSLGLTTWRWDMWPCLPDFASTMPALAGLDFPGTVAVLQPRRFDAVLSNTAVVLHGIGLAQWMELPHIHYIHEDLASPEFKPHGISLAAFHRMIADHSDYRFFCSDSLKEQWAVANSATLWPHRFSSDDHVEDMDKTVSLEPDSLPRTTRYFPNRPFSLQVIGVKSLRKNTHFMITVVKALRLRGAPPLTLSIIGDDSSGTATLLHHLQHRQEPDIYVYPKLDDPYALNREANPITISCAAIEPFGLTLIESLQQGIPTISARSGGGTEVCGEEMVFDVDDIDGCVRLLEAIFQDYNGWAEKAQARYQVLKSHDNCTAFGQRLKAGIDAAIANYSGDKKAGDFLRRLPEYRHLTDIGLNTDAIADNIAAISQLPQTDYHWSSDEVKNRIQEEKNRPGTAVLGDIRKFDVVPFAMSEAMNRLYKNGLGLAIELAATFDDEARVKMAAFILGWLHNLNPDKSARILAVGDGLGIDAIRLARCGYHIDYMDYDGSLMSLVAQRNVALAKQSCDVAVAFVNSVQAGYDFIICLEVIEHIEQPTDFLRWLAEQLNPDGYVFLSECFDGIYNRWPTHLYRNERYINQIGHLAAPYFVLEDVALTPYGKPYLFRKIN